MGDVDVTPPPPAVAAVPDPQPAAGLAEILLRMPESLRMHVEQLAAVEGISVNTWLVRCVTVAVNQQHGPPPAAHGAWSGKRVTGYLPS
ncbi:hypothetical protein [Actinoplanes sp. NPDC023714]|uniref:hypothetical protein n=1 Tax=Actinoplanes sp. NPDC023714 TaxID=3154322 RepID=UPI0033F67052